jgi:hypothetical protein
MAYDYAYTRLSAKAKPGESMLARIIRLDAVLLSRYKGDDGADESGKEHTINKGDSQGKRATGKKRKGKPTGAARKSNSKGTASKNRKKSPSEDTNN